MSAYKTVTLSRTGDGELSFTPAVLGWRPDSYPANMQITVSGLNGGTFDVYILPADDDTYRLAYEAATEADIAVIAGKEAPLVAAVALVVAGTSGATVIARLTLWERGI
jgi:hypothetical protein